MLDTEFCYITGFARGCEEVDYINVWQLKALWTAYCLHNSLVPDTAEYDNNLLELWELVIAANCAEWIDENMRDRLSPDMDYTDFDVFDLFMGEYLI